MTPLTCTKALAGEILNTVLVAAQVERNAIWKATPLGSTLDRLHSPCSSEGSKALPESVPNAPKGATQLAIGIRAQQNENRLGNVQVPSIQSHAKGYEFPTHLPAPDRRPIAASFAGQLHLPTTLCSRQPHRTGVISSTTLERMPFSQRHAPIVLITLPIYFLLQFNPTKPGYIPYTKHKAKTKPDCLRSPSKGTKARPLTPT